MEAEYAVIRPRVQDPWRRKKRGGFFLGAIFRVGRCGVGQKEGDGGKAI